ncbi:hypothetical protein LCGC14_1309890 [marine sediment metagenome]|uniref:Uncharacterized protein n=1 Tax=marine sediment metagenome TaxID=412755 RepID=A0A0F9KN79_9ZZZZ
MEAHQNITGPPRDKRVERAEEEDHTITVERELVNIQDGNEAPDHCDYCGAYWPCPFAVGKELL